jgi:hypothetical protein
MPPFVTTRGGNPENSVLLRKKCVQKCDESDNQFPVLRHLDMKHLIASLLIPVLLTLTACRPDDHGHSHDHSADGHGHDHEHGGHHHETPHGGTAVVLGDEAFHLELLQDTETGTLTAFVMDGHMENFLRVPNKAIQIALSGGTTNAPLNLQPIANNATGETIGDTSQFSASADWLKTSTNFDAVIPSIKIREQTFTNVTFNFPKGNE